MNKTIAAAIIALSAAAPLAAQTTDPATTPVAAAEGSVAKMEGRRAARLERMAVELGLTEEQKSQVQGVFEEQAAKRRALREETHARLAEILTEEQRTKMAEMRAQHKKRGGKHGGRHGRKHGDGRGKDEARTSG